MKYSSAFLRKFVNINVGAKDLADKLTLKTCEIEEVIERKLPQDVVIGKAEKVERHPDADKLFVCQLDCGDKGKYQILTGGENIVADVYVAVALPGCYLPVIDLKIEARQMRGLDSNGMICSKGELGINEDEGNHRIRLLNEDFDDITDEDLGKPLSDKYTWLDSWIMDVDNKTITHRPDLTGHWGLAVEANTIYEKSQGILNEWMDRFSDVNFVDSLLENGMSNMDSGSSPEGHITEDGKKDGIKVETDKVFVYHRLNISNVRVNRSSFFTRLQLIDLGHEPINNWVDFSNIFMYLTGQPIHFFDSDKVDGDIIIRNAKDGEIFVDLGGKEHKLESNDIVIADKNKILALAGIIGGENSGITQETKNIIVEIANFDPVQVRKTGTRLGLRTDAELRFEKNINPMWTVVVVSLFKDLLQYYSKDLGDFGLGEHGLYYDEDIVMKLRNKHIELDMGYVDMLLYGAYTENHDMYVEILKNLGFVFSGENVMVPFWRSPDDINIPADIAEEVARHIGYDNLPLADMQQGVIKNNWMKDVAIRRKIEEISVNNLRADQLDTYPWVAEKTLDLWGVDKDTLYTVNNPLDVDQKFLRDDLIYNLLTYTARNSKFFDKMRVWDYGKVRGNAKMPKGRSDEMKQYDSSGEIALSQSSSPNTRGQAQGHIYAKDFVNESNAWGYVIYNKKIDNWEEDSVLEAKSAIGNIINGLNVSSVTNKIPASAGMTNMEQLVPDSLQSKSSKVVNRNNNELDCHTPFSRSQGQLKFEKTSNPNYHPKKQANVFVGNTKVGFVGAVHPSILAEYKIDENASLSYVSLDMDVLADMVENEYSDQFYTLQDQIVDRDLCFVIDTTLPWSVVTDVVENIPSVIGINVFDLYAGDKLPEGKKSIAFTISIKGENMSNDEINKVMNEVIDEVGKVGGELRK